MFTYILKSDIYVTKRCESLFRLRLWVCFISYVRIDVICSRLNWLEGYNLRLSVTYIDS